MFAVAVVAFATVARSDDASRVQPLVEVPLSFSARGQKLPVPLVPVRLHGTDGHLLVDTGSSHNALTRDFAEAHDLAGAPAGTGRDHAGETVTTSPAKAIDWELGGVSRRVEDAIVVAGPPPFKPLGVVGFLSPQNFFGAASVVLDFPAGRLMALSGDASAVRAWAESRYPEAEIAVLPRAAGPHARKLYVQAQLASGESVVAEIDTGGSTTEFAENLLPADGNGETLTSVAVSGKKRAARLVEGQTLSLGGVRFSPLKVKARPTGATPAVLLGIDLLRYTVLIIPAAPDAPFIVLRPRVG
jgi:hypothetical protein